MTEVMRQPATYEDLLKVPEHMVAEIIDGELITSPRPAFRHARATGRLYSQVAGLFDEGDGGPGGWWIVIEPELHLRRDILVPDIAGWRKERVPEFPDVTFIELAPDWVCEVVSPSSSRLDRAKKLPRYAKYQINHAWIVDPTSHTLEVYRRGGEHFALVETHEGSTLVHAEPFDACDINLGALWID